MAENFTAEIENERFLEDESLLKRLHRPIRKWYKTKPELKVKYGNFPLFWQDLKGWEFWTEIRKTYMKETEDTNREADVDAPTPISKPDYNEQLLADAQEKYKQLQASKSTETAEQDTKAVVADPESVTAGSTSEGPAESKATEQQTNSQDSGDKPNKRKRSRWGNASDKKPRKSRWSAEEKKPDVPNVAKILAENQPKLQQLREEFEQVCVKLVTVVEDAKKEATNPDRPPSPTPTYDSNGVRTNNRETRMREALLEKRNEVLEEAISLNPLFTSVKRANLTRKLYIPLKEFPEYNFIGLIIGPRGNTHRKMESESGCKIAIRGRGSVKEGKGRKESSPDDDDELHVLIQGKDEQSVNLAEEMIAELLIPVDDEINNHKQKQLRELALINGTLRAEEYCTICGEKGHRQFECPNRNRNYQMADVCCKICGERSHVTADCPIAKQGHTVEMDNEYLNLMNELDGGSPAPAPAPAVPAPAGATPGAPPPPQNAPAPWEAQGNAPQPYAPPTTYQTPGYPPQPPGAWGAAPMPWGAYPQQPGYPPQQPGYAQQHPGAYSQPYGYPGQPMPPYGGYTGY